ncbi:MAG: lysophospholipid acyltransferase family protein [Polyangiales bacterium]
MSEHDDPGADAIPVQARIGVAVGTSPLGRWLAEGPIRWFRASMDHVEKIPASGGALLVGNHALSGLDGFTLASLVIRERGRYVRFLGERNLWRMPVLGELLTELGAVPGDPARAVEMLRAGELVGVYPGGVDDSFKPASERHRLQWGTRAGFARVAMRAGVPIIPIAGVGIDDMYRIVGKERWLGRRLLGSSRYDLPIAFGHYGTLIPRRNPQRFVVLDPIETRGDPDCADDVERVRRGAFDALTQALRAHETPLQ